MLDAKMIKRHAITVVSTIVLLLVITIGVSYSAYYRIKTDDTSQTVAAGNLSVIVNTSSSSQGKPILRTLTNTEGQNQTTYSTITITNNGNVDAAYFLTFGYDATASDALIPFDLVRLKIYDSSGNEVSSIIDPSASPIRYSTGAAATAYQNQVDILYVPSIAAGATQTYRIKAWIDKDMISDARLMDGGEFLLDYLADFNTNFKITANYVAKDSQQYSINFIPSSSSFPIFMLNNSSSNYLNAGGTTISLIPGSYTYYDSTINSDFDQRSIRNVLTIQIGDTLSLNKIGYANLPTSGNYLSVYSCAMQLNQYPLYIRNYDWNYNDCRSLDSNINTCVLKCSNNWDHGYDGAIDSDRSYSYILTIPNTMSTQIPINLTIASNGQLTLS
jgi:hypothetical protein